MRYGVLKSLRGFSRCSAMIEGNNWTNWKQDFFKYLQILILLLKIISKRKFLLTSIYGHNFYYQTFCYFSRLQNIKYWIWKTRFAIRKQEIAVLTCIWQVIFLTPSTIDLQEWFQEKRKIAEIINLNICFTKWLDLWYEKK